MFSNDQRVNDHRRRDRRGPHFSAPTLPQLIVKWVETRSSDLEVKPES